MKHNAEERDPFHQEMDAPKPARKPRGPSKPKDDVDGLLDALRAKIEASIMGELREALRGDKDLKAGFRCLEQLVAGLPEDRPSKKTALKLFGR